MATIPLMVNAPPPTINGPLSTFQAILQARDVQSQIAQRQALTQQANQQSQDLAAQAAIRQKQVQDQNTLQKMLADPEHPEYAAQYGKGDLSFANGKVSPEFQTAIGQKVAEARKEAIANDTGEASQKLEAWTQAGKTLAGLQHLYDSTEATTPGQGAANVAAAYPGAVQALKQLPGLQGVQLPQSIDGSPQTLAQLAAHVNSSASFYQSVAEQKKADEAVKTQTADTAQNLAKAAEENANANKTSQMLPGELTAQQQQLTGKQPIQPKDLLEARMKAQALGIEAGNLAVNQGRLAQETKLNAMKYGDGTADFWAHQLQTNPDSVKELPAELRSAVGQKFTAATGLPLPTPANANAQAAETAARNALDNASFIQKALQNPEIKANIGPIMGRLGNLEQTIGAAPNLSPEASQLAQELRTRMRYFVFQEGKAVLGGRLPQDLMHQLESSSASVHMEPDMLNGALNGAIGNAKTVMNNVDAQRFGGQVRPDSMRSLPQTNTTGATSSTTTAPTRHTIKLNNKLYQYKGNGNTADINNYDEVKQ